MPRALTLFILIVLLSTGGKVYADFMGQCLGGDGKFHRCTLSVDQGNLMIRYKPGPVIQVPGKRIFRVVYDSGGAVNKYNPDVDPVFLSALYRDYYSSTFIPYYDSVDQNSVLGVQFTDETGGRNALMMRLNKEDARSLQSSLEGISNQRAVPLK